MYLRVEHTSTQTHAFMLFLLTHDVFRERALSVPYPCWPFTLERSSHSPVSKSFSLSFCFFSHQKCYFSYKLRKLIFLYFVLMCKCKYVHVGVRRQTHISCWSSLFPLFKSGFLFVTAAFIPSRTTCKGMVPPTVGGPKPYQSLI